LSKKRIREFLNKDWGLRRLNKLLKKLQESGMTARRSGSIESMQNISRFSALHEMPSRTSEKRIRPWVRLSVKRVDCDKTEERAVQIYIPYEKSFSLVF